MKFVAMAIQDHNEVSMYNGLPLETEVSLSHQLFSASSVHQKEHISSGKDNNRTPKVRKPYTITKQRERWTEDEHQKFLEALKLHGRAWRKIEEHIGTKTAVQIRSHAQKYFTKLIREASGSSIISTTESFEIPPPRPKRRPSHPYPRKRIEIPEKEISIEGHTMRSNSLKSSDLSDQEDQSPKSVLSIIGLDNLRCPSEEDDPTPNADSPFVLQNLPKFKLFPKKSSPAEEDMVEELNGKVVKLFGANLLATKKNSDIAEAPIGFVPRRTLVEDKAEKESSWCGSNITSSMNEGENDDDDDDDENTDPVEARSHMDCDVKGEQLSLFGRYMTTPSEPSTISELLERPKGFVPYKKFIAEKENKPLPLTVEERDGQCFRLFL